MTACDLLIAEDDAVLARAYALSFPPHGLTVRLARNGLEALEQIAARPPEILLLDLLMPEMNGLEVLESLATKGLTFPVIVFTNITKESSRKRCLELGAKDYIIKCDVSLRTLGERILAQVSA